MVIEMKVKCKIYEVYVVYLVAQSVIKHENRSYAIYLIQEAKRGELKYWCLIKWGAVGRHPQSKLLGDGEKECAMQNFIKKLHHKTGLTWETRNQSPPKGKYRMGGEQRRRSRPSSHE